jgi:hypothetical protein
MWKSEKATPRPRFKKRTWGTLHPPRFFSGEQAKTSSLDLGVEAIRDSVVPGHPAIDVEK